MSNHQVDPDLQMGEFLLPAMRVFTCTNAKGHWPVGFAAIVVAPSEEIAKRMLQTALAEDGLADQPQGYTLKEVHLNTPAATILVNGEY